MTTATMRDKVAKIARSGFVSRAGRQHGAGYRVFFAGGYLINEHATEDAAHEALGLLRADAIIAMLDSVPA